MYQKISSSWGKHLDVILLDALFLQIAFVLAYITRHGMGQLPYSVPLYQRMAIILVLIEISVVFFGEAYTGMLRRGHLQELKAVIKFVTAIVVCDVVVLFLTQTSGAFSRSVFIQLWAFGILLLYLERKCLKHILKKRNRKKGNKRSILIATTLKLADETLTTVSTNRYGQFTIGGIILLDKHLTGRNIQNKPTLPKNTDKTI